MAKSEWSPLEGMNACLTSYVTLFRIDPPFTNYSFFPFLNGYGSLTTQCSLSHGGMTNQPTSHPANKHPTYVLSRYLAVGSPLDPMRDWSHSSHFPLKRRLPFERLFSVPMQHREGIGHPDQSKGRMTYMHHEHAHTLHPHSLGRRTNTKSTRTNSNVVITVDVQFRWLDLIIDWLGDSDQEKGIQYLSSSVCEVLG